MRRTQVSDCRTVPWDVATVYAALTDFENYPQWWPAELRLRVLKCTDELVGSRFQVRPRGGSFTCEAAQVIPLREIDIRYVDGLHRGAGRWTFEPQGEATRLCYKIDLEPQGWLPRLLSHFMNFAAIHSRGMERLFDGLEGWLRKQ